MSHPEVGPTRSETTISAKFLKLDAPSSQFWAIRALPLQIVATAPSLETKLNPLVGDARPLSDWLTTFPLILGVIDPYTHESGWLLDTFERIFHHFRGSDARVSWLVTSNEAGAKKFLGPLAEEYLTFADPDRTMVKSLDLETLPALVVIKQDGSIVASAEGWDPSTWRPVTEMLASLTHWSRPTIPSDGDPVPYPGTPADGT